MRVRIDSQLCQGHARCISLVPEAFGFDDDTHQAVALPEEEIADVPTERLLVAVRACPEKAIIVNEAEDGC